MNQVNWYACSSAYSGRLRDLLSWPGDLFPAAVHDVPELPVDLHGFNDDLEAQQIVRELASAVCSRRVDVGGDTAMRLLDGTRSAGNRR